MQRKISKKSLYNAGKNKTDETIIHLHMSNHYKRILNAKKAIDCSPPYCYKLRKGSGSKENGNKSTQKPQNQVDILPLTDRSMSTNSNRDSCWGGDSGGSSSRYHARCIPNQGLEARHGSNTSPPTPPMDLVDRIAYDTKNGPGAYCDEGWLEVKAQHNDKHYQMMNARKPQGSLGKSQRQIRSTIDCSLHRKAAVQLAHLTQAKQESASNSTNPLESSCVCISNETVVKKTSFNPKEQSVTSSRDSAYNGGVSSVPESRSPTPDQRNKKECCCCCCQKKQQEEKTFEPSKPPSGRAETPRSPKPPLPTKNPPTPKPRASSQEESYRKIQEDALYVKFIQDITTEILQKNLYTNKALKKVMKKHIRNNQKKLQKDRMLREIENLRIQLGIPEDKSLLQLEAEGDGGSCDSSSRYPIISDSEFVMPKTTTEGRDRVPKSISGVMMAMRKREKTISETETDGPEEISPKQTSKSIRDRRGDKETEGSIGRRMSSDDSDRPSDPKKRSLVKNRKPKFSRAYSTSSSDTSERSDRFSRAVPDQPEREEEAYPSGTYVQRCTYLSKKNRSVSFWKNPNLSRGFNSRLEKTVFRSRESPLLEKRKND